MPIISVVTLPNHQREPLPTHDHQALRQHWRVYADTPAVRAALDLGVEP